MWARKLLGALILRGTIADISTGRGGSSLVKMGSSHGCRQSVKTGRASTSCSATACRVRTTAVFVSMPVGQLGMVGADCQLDEGALLGGAGECVLRVAPG